MASQTQNGLRSLSSNEWRAPTLCAHHDGGGVPCHAGKALDWDIVSP